MTGLITVTTDAQSLHDPPYQFDDGQVVKPLDMPQRVDCLLRAATRASTSIVAAGSPDLGTLAQIHDPGMLHFLEHAAEQWAAEGLTGQVFPDSFGPRNGIRRIGEPASVRALAGYFCRDTCTPITGSTWTAAVTSAAAAATAARLLGQGNDVVYALCRPPGHHAGRAEFSGFCYLNNAALAASLLKSKGKVAIVDVDFHHGNGTQDIFWNDPDVFYCSIHGSPAQHFPFFSGWPDERGGEAAPRGTFNMPLDDGTDGTHYLEAFARALDMVARFDPATIVVSGGFDIAGTDPVGTFMLSDDDLHAIAVALRQVGRPLVVVQEGGYDVAGLERQGFSFLTGLTRLSAPGRQVVARSLAGWPAFARHRLQIIPLRRTCHRPPASREL